MCASTRALSPASAGSLSTKSARDVCIVSAVRTPIGGFNGALSPLSATALGGVAIEGAIARTGIDKAAVEYNHTARRQTLHGLLGLGEN